jgi:hypothetical protein
MCNIPRLRLFEWRSNGSRPVAFAAYAKSDVLGHKARNENWREELSKDCLKVGEASREWMYRDEVAITSGRNGAQTEIDHLCPARYQTGREQASRHGLNRSGNVSSRLNTIENSTATFR